jgi:hypothetical protein
VTPYRVLEVERVLRIILKVLGWRVLQIIVQNAEAQRQAALDRHTDTCRAPQLKCIGVLKRITAAPAFLESVPVAEPEKITVLDASYVIYRSLHAKKGQGVGRRRSEARAESMAA